MSRLTYFITNAGPITPPYNIGPLNIGTPSVITSFRLTGNLISGVGQIASGVSIGQPYAACLQYVAQGAAPLDLVANANDPAILALQWIPWSVAVAWAPDTDTADFFAVVGVDLLWQGQWPIYSNTDVYATLDTPLESVQTGFQGMFEVNYV